MEDSKNPHLSLMTNALRMWARACMPKLDGKIRSNQIEKPIEILRDSWGVPHIYAREESDLFFAQGFVHAQDRLWQMEFNRRLIAGRLSEILGEVALPLDRWMRILTMRRVAEYETGLLDEISKTALQSYANGVNTAIARQRKPLEFSLLRYKPEPWVIADTLSWIKMMAWTLSVNWEAELLRAHLVDLLGSELASELEPPCLPRWPLIIPPGADYSNIDSTALARAQAARPFTGPSPYMGIGSNNWVLDGNHTTTGKPLLANDMHLLLSNPAIWYENHLQTEDLTLVGVTFPGIPGIIAGHNGSVAWGYTNGFPDVQDLYLERIRKLPDGTIEAEYLQSWEKAQVLHEKIEIKGREPVVQEVLITRHGPIINELAKGSCGSQPIALRWTALEPDTMVKIIFEIGKAKNCHQFHHALRLWTNPVQNVVYADIHGDIGFTFAGKVPIRSKGRGQLPVPGWTDEYEWSGYVPFDALPHLENPPQGFIVTANNRVVGDDYPIRLDIEPICGDRAQRITEMILDAGMRNGEDKIDIPFIKLMQVDQISPSARFMAKQLAQIHESSSAHSPESDLHAVLHYFKDWDGSLSSESSEAALYEVFIRRLVRLVLSAKIDAAIKDKSNVEKSANNTYLKKYQNIEEVTNWIMGKGPTPVLAEASLYGEHWLPWLIDIMKDPNSHWFDLGQAENKDEVIRKALDLAITDLKNRFGGDISNWRWGDLHQLTFGHVLGSQAMLKPLFNLGPFPIGGDNTTIWAAGTSYHNLDNSRMVGPPFRMIIDLGQLENSVAVLAPGQSGNPASPHFRDQIMPWMQGEYRPMLIRREDIQREKKHRLRIVPG